MRYVFQRGDAIGFASALMYETSERGNELWFKRCPYCGSNSEEAYKFSINLESGAFKCFRATCGKQGHFAELARDFDYELESLKPVQYKQLPQRKPDPTKYAIEYLKSRGISEDVARLYRITTMTNDKTILVIPFYDEQGRLTCIKYRRTNFDKKKHQNKEWFEKDTMPILFGMEQAKDYDEPLVITEGQMDALALATAGIKNPVSVPTGANGFKWLTVCMDWILRFPYVVVFGDYEHNKVTLVDGIRARLENRVRSVQPKYYLGEKDANDILIAYGSKPLIDAVENAEAPSYKIIKPLEQVEAVDINSIPKIMTGIDSLDRITNGMCLGQVILLTGKRGDGKSTFMSQLMVNALEQGESVFAYSGELPDFHFKRWLDYQLAGVKNLSRSTNRWGEDVFDIPATVEDLMQKWYSGRAFIYDNNFLPEDDVIPKLPDVIEEAIKRYNVRLIAIDNLMTAMDDVTARDNLYLMQSNFVGKLKKIAMKYQVAIILVAHPRKSNGTEFDNDDVSGSSDITNKVDIVMSYRRAKDSEDCDSVLTVSKNRITGKTAMGDNALHLFYSAASKRIDDCRSDRHYGWEPKEEKTIGLEELPF